jgi:hypothetical protein
MNVVLWACVVYFIGITVVLFLRPSLMFTKTGDWKEFGYNQEDRTVFPFWLFCFVWALASYTIVQYLSGDTHSEPVLPIQSMATAATAPSIANSFLVSEPNRTSRNKKRRSASVDMQPGYYMLNKEQSDIDGVPKYVFLGREPPERSRAASEG